MSDHSDYIKLALIIEILGWAHKLQRAGINAVFVPAAYTYWEG